MALFRTLRKVFRDFVKVENIVPISLDGASAGSKAGIQAAHLNSYVHAESLTFSPLFRTLLKHGQFRTYASALRRDAIARLVGTRTQAFKTSSLLAFLGVAYKSGDEHKPDLKDICDIFQLSFKNYLEENEKDETSEKLSDKVEHYQVQERLGQPSSCAAVYSVIHQSKEYAMKMMYNYGIQSNTLMIRKAFHKEYALLKTDNHKNDSDLPVEFLDKYPLLPPHPNIIKMYQSFVDKTQCYDDSMDSYPDALPRRLNPSGFGRNNTLFLVMPKYDCSLKQYNSSTLENEISNQTRLLVLLQMLEAILHLGKYNVAHRDLKADNILIKMDNGLRATPSVVLTDFGCCLCDSSWGMKIPYQTSEVDKGGNPALMAPEILCQQPGIDVFLDYTKSDVWSIGTLIYEIFNADNPFTKGCLNSATYTGNDLPHLPSSAPKVVDHLMFLMLCRDPSERISATLAATYVALILYAPNKWFGYSPGKDEIFSWLTQSYLSVIHDVYLAGDFQHADVELKTRLTFLSRVSVEEIQECLHLMEAGT